MLYVVCSTWSAQLNKHRGRKERSFKKDVVLVYFKKDLFLVLWDFSEKEVLHLIITIRNKKMLTPLKEKR